MNKDQKLKETATLLFVVKDGNVLLIHKKRGIGKGLWNAPGGRVDPNETPIMGALREFKEEVRAEADNIKKVGELEFYIPTDDDFSMRVFVFRADDLIGHPQETDEAVQWFSVDDLPWGKMWMDDRIWLPHVLKGRYVEGVFTMEGHDLTHVELEWH
jgi:8-oxo-dGTP diphosphatase